MSHEPLVATVTQADLDAKYQELRRDAGVSDSGGGDYAVLAREWERYLESLGCIGGRRYHPSWGSGGVWQLMDWLSALVEVGRPAVILDDPRYDMGGDGGLLAFPRSSADVCVDYSEADRRRLHLVVNCTDPFEATQRALEIASQLLDGSRILPAPAAPSPPPEAGEGDLDFDFNTSPALSEYDLANRVPEPVTSVWVLQFHHIDNEQLIPPVAAMPDEFRRGCPCPPEMVADVLRAAGWMGDGEIGYIYLPPFVFPDSFIHADTFGCVVYHVKQYENGTSFILADYPLPLPMGQQGGGLDEWREYPLPRNVADWKRSW